MPKVELFPSTAKLEADCCLQRLRRGFEFSGRTP